MVKTVELREQIVARIHDGVVRTEDLIESEDQIVDIERLNINGTMRRQRNRVNHDQRPVLVDHARDFTDRVHGAQNIRNIGYGDEPGPIVHQSPKIVKVQLQCLAIDLPEADADAQLLERNPGTDVRLVIGNCDDDLIACAHTHFPGQFLVKQ